jgi:hypothetical protein
MESIHDIRFLSVGGLIKKCQIESGRRLIRFGAAVRQHGVSPPTDKGLPKKLISQ